MESDADFMNEIDETETLKDIKLSDKLPKSFIVFEAHKDERDNMKKYLLIAHDLFNKYIDYSSQFEINISYQQRRTIINFVNEFAANRNQRMLDSVDPCEMYTLFDDAANTV